MVFNKYKVLGGEVLDILLKISIVLCFGLIGGKIANKLKLPNVSGYLVFGLFLGPSFINLIKSGEGATFKIINDIALGVIAFSIGSEFLLKDMKKLGKSIVVITLAEVIGAVFCVFAVMYYGFNQDFAFSIVIAAMSAATAPAATLLVIRQYRAHGPVTKTLLPVAALDDVFGIMVFGIAISLAVLTSSGVKPTLMQMISQPLLEIGGSLLLGIVLSLILVFIVKRLKNHSNLQVISLTAIGLGSGLAVSILKITNISQTLEFSPLLTNIVMGAMVANLLPNSDKVFASINDFISPIYVLFFTLAGASLDLSVLKSVGWMGVAYIFARATGKILGSFIGALSVKAEKTVTKYLGFALLPQGGISIGLTSIVAYKLSEYSVQIATIIMFSVLIYEVSGPIFAKIAISKAGEIGGLDRLIEENYEISENVGG